jgi:ubiquitin conjugation factor E4 B
VNYFRIIPFGRSAPRITLADEATFGSDDRLDQDLSQITNIDDDRSHFISELFFLTSYARWIGLRPVIQCHAQVQLYINELQRESDSSSRAKKRRTELDDGINRRDFIRRQLQEMSLLKAAMDCVLDCDLPATLNFLGFLATWLLRLADERHEHPGKTIRLPLKDVSFEWISLPQFLIEIITDYFIHMMRYSLTRIN